MNGCGVQGVHKVHSTQVHKKGHFTQKGGCEAWGEGAHTLRTLPPPTASCLFLPTSSRVDLAEALLPLPLQRRGTTEYIYLFMAIFLPRVSVRTLFGLAVFFYPIAGATAGGEARRQGRGQRGADEAPRGLCL